MIAQAIIIRHKNLMHWAISWGIFFFFEWINFWHYTITCGTLSCLAVEWVYSNTNSCVERAQSILESVSLGISPSLGVNSGPPDCRQSIKGQTIKLKATKAVTRGYIQDVPEKMETTPSNPQFHNLWQNLWRDLGTINIPPRPPESTRARAQVEGLHKRATSISIWPYR
jgi:hypothetical protein